MRLMTLNCSSNRHRLDGSLPQSTNAAGALLLVRPSPIARHLLLLALTSSSASAFASVAADGGAHGQGTGSPMRYSPIHPASNTSSAAAPAVRAIQRRFAGRLGLRSS